MRPIIRRLAAVALAILLPVAANAQQVLPAIVSAAQQRAIPVGTSALYTHRTDLGLDFKFVPGSNCSPADTLHVQPNAGLGCWVYVGPPPSGAVATLTPGTHLTGTPYDGSAPVTIGTDATSADTPSTIVARDPSGSAALGASTATTQALNDATTKLATDQFVSQTYSSLGGVVAPHLATEALLAAAATTAYPNGVWRDDFAAARGAAPLFYQPSGSACSLNGGNGDNGSQVKSADGKCWIAVFPDGIANVLEFGAIPDFTTTMTDNTGAINAALATGLSTYVPAGRYYVAGNLGPILGRGQQFYGNGPGQNDAGTDLEFGAGSGDGIQIGCNTGGCFSTYNWTQVHDFNLTSTLRAGNRVLGTAGVPISANIIPTANTVSVYNGLHVNLYNLNITNPWNGVAIIGSNTTTLENVIQSNNRGDFNVGIMGTAAGDQSQVLIERNSSHSANHVTILASGASSAGQAVITLANTTGIDVGDIVTGSSGLPARASVPTLSAPNPATAVVASINPGVSVTLAANLTGSGISNGASLTFHAPAVGTWMGPWATSYSGWSVRHQQVQSFLLMDDPANNSGAQPADVWLYDLGGDTSQGDLVNIVSGVDVHLSDPHIYGSATGRGVYWGPASTQLTINGGEIAANGLAGIEIAGEGATLSGGTTISENSQFTVHTYDGVDIDATASNTKVIGDQIGFLNTTPPSPKQAYGINIASGATNTVIANNNLTGNNTGAINGAANADLIIGNIGYDPVCPLATGSAFGCVKPDGTSITISGGTISAPGGSGISQLTGDVTAGPGTGSQAASVAAIGGKAVSLSGPLSTTGTGTIVAALGNTSGTIGLSGVVGKTALATDLSNLASPITTLGTVGTGVWNATPIAQAYTTPTSFATGSSTGNTLTGPREYFVCTSTCTVTPPVPVAGYEFCVLNNDNVSTVITLGALGSSARYENTARTAYGTAGTGTFISGGAVGDKVCIVGQDSTHYLTTASAGTWTAN